MKIRKCAKWSLFSYPVTYNVYNKKCFSDSHFFYPCPYLTSPSRRGRVWLIWTQCLGQGKEFEHSNEIAALAESYGSPTAGMKSTTACCINFNRQLTHSRAHDQSDPRFVSLLQCRRAPTKPCSQTKETVQIHQTPFPFLGWGLGTRLVNSNCSNSLLQWRRSHSAQT